MKSLNFKFGAIEVLATELIIAKVQDHDMKAVKTNVPVQNVYEVTA